MKNVKIKHTKLANFKIHYHRLATYVASSTKYGTAQFKLDIHMCFLVQLLKKFVMEITSFLQVHDHSILVTSYVYTREVHSDEVYFTHEQSGYVYKRVRMYFVRTRLLLDDLFTQLYTTSTLER